MKGIRKTARDLGGQTDTELVHGLVGQIDATMEGIEQALRAVRGQDSGEHARSQMTRIEHSGDEERSRVVRTLSASLTSPIDREDLFRLSRSIDDVLDNMRDFVREHTMFELEEEPLLEELVEAVGDGVLALREAVVALGEEPGSVPLASLSAKKNEIRPRYQKAMAELLIGEVTVEMLRRRELLRRLDVVGLRLGEAADALADGAIKRSH